MENTSSPKKRSRLFAFWNEGGRRTTGVVAAAVVSLGVLAGCTLTASEGRYYRAPVEPVVVRPLPAPTPYYYNGAYHRYPQPVYRSPCYGRGCGPVVVVPGNPPHPRPMPPYGPPRGPHYNHWQNRN